MEKGDTMRDRFTNARHCIDPKEYDTGTTPLPTRALPVNRRDAGSHFTQTRSHKNPTSTTHNHPKIHPTYAVKTRHHTPQGKVCGAVPCRAGRRTAAAEQPAPPPPPLPVIPARAHAGAGAGALLNCQRPRHGMCRLASVLARIRVGNETHEVGGRKRG